jgi:hypothetical protein
MRTGLSRLIVPAVLAMLAIPLSAAGQIPAAAEGPIDPPPPALPQTLSRDDQGRATVRAVRLSAPMRTDGRLDEAIYQDVHPASRSRRVWPRPALRAR